MNKKWFIVGLTCLSIMIFGSFAAADLIVSTGPSLYLSSTTLSSSQWLGAEFTVPAPGYTVTDIEGIFNAMVEGEIEVFIKADSGDYPTFFTEAPLLSSSFYLNYPSQGWFGVHGENLVLEGNTDYWVVFGVSSSTSTQAEMPAALLPLDNYVIGLNQGMFWAGDDSIDIGVRIYGDATPAPIPEPATILLIGTGLVGFAVPRIRKKLKK